MNFADVTFEEDGIPRSVTFDDVYFSQGRGIDETNFVFIEPNHLKERFQSLKGLQNFTIAETGFGTGLNFLVAWQHFLMHAPDTARMTFISCEKYPIAPADLVKTHSLWPELSKLSDQLQQQYPPALQGFHLLEFERVNLILIYDDAAMAFANTTASVDAWFLDGFAPSRNPEMWQSALFTHIQRLSHQNTTLSTFACARPVKQGLAAVGFKLKLLSGFEKKRNMLSGTFIGINGPSPMSSWPSSELPTPLPNKHKNIAIIGAGIAGTTTAIELKKRGYNVVVFEKNSVPASGGSGNIQGAVYAKLSAKPNVTTQFYAQALIKAQHVLAHLPTDVPHDVSGLVQLVHNEKELKRLDDLTASNYIPKALAEEKNAEELTELLGIEVPDAGLWFKDGGWVNPAKLVEHLLNANQIACQYDTEITALTETKTGWSLTASDQRIFEFDQVVLASAHETTNFAQTAHLPIKGLAGQVTQLKPNTQINKLRAVICTDRYVMPAYNDKLTIGSTFRLRSTETDVREIEHEENIQSLKNRVPAMLPEHSDVIGGRAAVRCTSPDYMPMVGPLCEPTKFNDQFALPLQRKRTNNEPPARHINGLWVNIAHGSKALCSSHLCAKLLAAMISGEPYPLQKPIIQHLNPSRFLVRAIIKAQREKT